MTKDSTVIPSLPPHSEKFTFHPPRGASCLMQDFRFRLSRELYEQLVAGDKAD
jgi:hypothetical protein